MTSTSLGIHHITAIAGNPQKNVDFYTQILGLRTVKKTVNFDDPFTYHFYYGVADGSPGTILTFFPWGERGFIGRRGAGQVTAISYSIPETAVDFWTQRFKKYNIPFAGPFSRFDEEVIVFADPDDIELELVASASDKRPAGASDGIAKQYAIRGFYNATISLSHIDPTLTLLIEALQFRQSGESEKRVRLEAGDGGPGTLVDLLHLPNERRGSMGIGAVHHIAWRIANNEGQLTLRDDLLQKGYNVSPIMDRQYFQSIYFHEPGGTLFEVATDPPGFTIDETPESLGTQLKLPPWLEGKRHIIEQKLQPVEWRKGKNR